MKKILSFVLTAAVLLTFCAFAVSADSTATLGSVVVERTFEFGSISNTSLYRFKATPYTASSDELSGNVTYTWTVYHNGTALNSSSYTHEHSRNFFAFQPPASIKLPAVFEVVVKASAGGVEVTSEQTAFKLQERLPDSAKAGLEAAIAMAAFRSQSRYTVASWARMELLYLEAVAIWQDNSLAEGATIGSITDKQRIDDAAAALNKASEVTESGDGLHVSPDRMDGFMGTLLPIIEKVNAMLWKLVGIKFGGFKIPFKRGMFSNLF
ncbi:MAG: hypothetical protein LBJ12_05120 [Oscillospiraceae bacterium]|jgi:hypothetical protein|nr:hypothetical protein [Oscillospiraceae bacterium]